MASNDKNDLTSAIKFAESICKDNKTPALIYVDGVAVILTGDHKQVFEGLVTSDLFKSKDTWNLRQNLAAYQIMHDPQNLAEFLGELSKSGIASIHHNDKADAVPDGIDEIMDYLAEVADNQEAIYKVRDFCKTLITENANTNTN